MGMTYCRCERCGEDMLLDNFDLFRFGQLCDECRAKLAKEKQQERAQLPPKKPSTSIPSLIVWGGFSFSSAAVFWYSFAQGLRTGEFLAAFHTDLALAICATVLLICVLVEAWRVFRSRK